MAQPVAPVPYARVVTATSFPVLNMPRLQAGVDILLALVLVFGFMVLIGMSPLGWYLAEWLSFVGIF